VDFKHKDRTEVLNQLNNNSIEHVVISILQQGCKSGYATTMTISGPAGWLPVRSGICVHGALTYRFKGNLHFFRLKKLDYVHGHLFNEGSDPTRVNCHLRLRDTILVGSHLHVCVY